MNVGAVLATFRFDWLFEPATQYTGILAISHCVVWGGPMTLQGSSGNGGADKERYPRAGFQRLVEKGVFGLRQNWACDSRPRRVHGPMWGVVWVACWGGGREFVTGERECTLSVLVPGEDLGTVLVNEGNVQEVESKTIPIDDREVWGSEASPRGAERRSVCSMVPRGGSAGRRCRREVLFGRRAIVVVDWL